MKIAIMGAGGIGGYYGGRLAASGADVSFIARGAHLAAMQANGLKIISPLGDAHIAKVTATDDPSTIGPVDIVMFCVKLYDLEAACEACKPMIEPDTAVISFLNGIDSEDRMRAILGDKAVVGGTAQIPSNIIEPGVIEHKAPLAALEFGELDRSDSQRLQAFHDVCVNAGIETYLVENIETAIWLKFAILVPFATTCCLTRLPGKVLIEEPVVQEIAVGAMKEIIALAAAKGVQLPPDALESRMALLSNFANAMPSMLVDLLAEKRIELEGLQGAVVRLAKELGVPAPVHNIAYAALKPFENGPPDY
ncbi:MAG: 2-dehydropantoate 2-reductase [Rhodospirillaceae bacterium]|nr:2-dehydropantoate 2-reductase [Rhodospirillaceae bacterium]